jgi:hypothetical protein
MLNLLGLLGIFITISSAIPTPQTAPSVSTASAAVATCSGNTASDRSIWCDYDTRSDYYTRGPDTGLTVEVRMILSNSSEPLYTNFNSTGS